VDIGDARSEAPTIAATAYDGAAALSADGSYDAALLSLLEDLECNLLGVKKRR
jgi:hypothetical protein